MVNITAGSSLPLSRHPCVLKVPLQCILYSKISLATFQNADETFVFCSNAPTVSEDCVQFKKKKKKKRQNKKSLFPFKNGVNGISVPLSLGSSPVKVGTELCIIEREREKKKKGKRSAGRIVTTSSPTFGSCADFLLVWSVRSVSFTALRPSVFKTLSHFSRQGYCFESAPKYLLFLPRGPLLLLSRLLPSPKSRSGAR